MLVQWHTYFSVRFSECVRACLVAVPLPRGWSVVRALKIVYSNQNKHFCILAINWYLKNQKRLFEPSLENWDNGFFPVKCHRITPYVPDRPPLLLFDPSLVFLCKKETFATGFTFSYSNGRDARCACPMVLLSLSLIRCHFSTAKFGVFFFPNELSLLVEAISLFLTPIKI